MTWTVRRRSVPQLALLMGAALACAAPATVQAQTAAEIIDQMMSVYAERAEGVDNYTIVAGVPAKPIRRRFEKHVEEKLLQIAWWNWDHSQLQERLIDFRNLDIETFIKRYEKSD